MKCLGGGHHTVLCLVVVEHLDGLVASSSTNEVVGEMVLVALGLLDLIVGLLVELGWPSQYLLVRRDDKSKGIPKGILSILNDVDWVEGCER